MKNLTLEFKLSTSCLRVSTESVSFSTDSNQKDDDSGNKSEQTARIGLKRPREDDEFEDTDNGEKTDACCQKRSRAPVE